MSKINVLERYRACMKDLNVSFDLTLAGLEKSTLEAQRNFQEVLKFQASNEFPAFFLES